MQAQKLTYLNFQKEFESYYALFLHMSSASVSFERSIR
jgi:hypothetical protein